MTRAEKLQTIAENEQKVFEAGEKSEYDRFWDTYLNPTRSSLAYAFAGSGWLTETFKPKYDIRPELEGAYYLFNSNRINVDLVEHLNKCGVVLDFSNATNVMYAFYDTRFTRVGEINLSKVTVASSANNLFSNSSKLVTIDKIVLPSSRVNLTNAFDNCTSLQNITFEGTIRYNLNVQSCPLTHDSLMNIINCLGDGLSYTLTLGATNLAKLTEDEIDIAYQKGWTVQ